jgi:hypothetical protein
VTPRPRALLVGLAALTALAACGIDDRAPQLPGSTLEATIAEDGATGFSRGPAEDLLDRTELARRGEATEEVARFGQLSDPHVRDEESPARVPFLARLGPPLTSTFRPHEALSTQVLSAAVRSLNAERPSAVLVTGDLIDSAQRNELDQFLAVLEGGEVEPRSGAFGYRGVQNASNPDGFFYRPGVDAPQLPGLLTRAQRRFFAPGLRAPWFPALGNHDLHVQGELPPSEETDAVATGAEALLTFDPALEELLDDLPTGGSPTPNLRDVPRETIEELLAEGVPGETTPVAPDPRRRHLRAPELLRDLRAAAGLPAGGERLDYAIDLSASLRAIVLDTVDRSGGAGGTLEDGQVGFLRRELARAGGRSVVVVSPHGLDRVRGGSRGLSVLDRDPRVIAELAGDTHRHEIRPVPTSAGGFWRIRTGSLADWPQQSRMLRLVTGPGGQRALETWVVDHAGGLDTNDLAGAARVLANLDAQGGRPQGFAGRHGDRNARLWLPPAAGG